MSSPRSRAAAFCERLGIDVPILLAPMAGACPPSLSIAVANAGGMGAAGVLLHDPDGITQWARDFRAGSDRPFQLNLWVPDAPPSRDPAHEAEVRAFLGTFGPSVAEDAGDTPLLDFDAQCAAMLAARPHAISSVMGLFPPAYVAALKSRAIHYVATVSTLAEALEAEAAGADVIVAQGAEAGGHRAAFDPHGAERRMVGLVSLVPAIVDAVRVPVVATGGIADGRGIAAALALGASAVQIGTAFLRCPEAKLVPAWADALGRARPEDTLVTRAFSGRAGRSLANRFALAALSRHAPAPAPYPIQRSLTAAMRSEAQRTGDVDRMQAWAGQSAALARAEPAAEVVRRIWSEATTLLA